MNIPELELAYDPFEDVVHHARKYGKQVFKQRGRRFNDEFYALDDDLLRARKRLGRADLLRSQMPVLNNEDLERVKTMLDAQNIHELIGCVECKMHLYEIHPLQRQLHIDNVIDGLAQHSLVDSIKWYQNNPLIVSLDGFLIDGHHRWLGYHMLSDWWPDKKKVPVVKIDANADKLLPLLRLWDAMNGIEPNG